MNRQKKRQNYNPKPIAKWKIVQQSAIEIGIQEVKRANVILEDLSALKSRFAK